MAAVVTVASSASSFSDGGNDSDELGGIGDEGGLAFGDDAAQLPEEPPDFLCCGIRIRPDAFVGSASSSAFRRLIVLCPLSNSSHRKCKRRREISANNTGTLGDLEPAAFLLAWALEAGNCEDKLRHM